MTHRARRVDLDAAVVQQLLLAHARAEKPGQRRCSVEQDPVESRQPALQERNQERIVDQFSEITLLQIKANIAVAM